MTQLPMQGLWGGRSSITKAYVLDQASGDVVHSFPSKQIVDPFSGLATYGNQIRIPPYDLDQLAVLSETHPTHSAALEQKAADVIGPGFNVSVAEGIDPKLAAVMDERKRITNWWDALFEEYTSTETLLAMWEDYEILGWGMLEVVRDIDGQVRRLYHLPAHTVRATEDGYKFVQIREGKMVWFKLWGLGEKVQFYLDSGRTAPESARREQLANEVLVFKKPSRTSFWYGVPMYVSSLGFIALSLAARNFNIKFFENYREPRHLIMVSGLEADVDATMAELTETWRNTLRNNPHSNVVMPVAGQATVQVERLSTDINDLHFTQLIEMADTEILLSHRMPPDRLGVVKRGFLGGDVTLHMNKIYERAVVSKSQAILESRLQRFVKQEFAYDAAMNYVVDFEDLDIADIQIDSQLALEQVRENIITMNEGRILLGKDPLDKFTEDGEDLTWLEYQTVAERRLAEEQEEIGGGFDRPGLGGGFGGNLDFGGGGFGGGLGGDFGGDLGGDLGGEAVETARGSGPGRLRNVRRNGHASREDIGAGVERVKSRRRRDEEFALKSEILDRLSKIDRVLDPELAKTLLEN